MNSEPLQSILDNHSHPRMLLFKLIRILLLVIIYLSIFQFYTFADFKILDIKNGNIKRQRMNYFKILRYLFKLISLFRSNIPNF